LSLGIFEELSTPEIPTILFVHSKLLENYFFVENHFVLEEYRRSVSFPSGQIFWQKFRDDRDGNLFLMTSANRRVGFQSVMNFERYGF
jgi:hypothetical protein